VPADYPAAHARTPPPPGEAGRAIGASAECAASSVITRPMWTSPFSWTV